MPDVIVPYQGGTVVLSEAAQQAGKAAVEWAAANPEMANAMKGAGKNVLDKASARALRELEQRMRATPPKPATVINLHPWPLTFGAINRFMRGITIPACSPGQPFAHNHIRGYRRDWAYKEDGTLEFYPILPIQLASEFVREFSNRDNYGGGVIIYEGESNPANMLDKEVETYDPIGRMITLDKPGVEYDDENHPSPTTVQTPVKKRLSQLIEESREARNRLYLERVRKAEHDYKLPGGKGAWMVTPPHQLMAEVLFADHLIAALPFGDLSSKLELGMAENACPACGADPRAGAFKCAVCGHILSAFAAYKAGAIEYGHVAMETMTSDEWEEAEEIKSQREKAKTEAAERRKAAKSAKPAAEAKDSTRAKAEEPVRPKKEK